MKMTEAEQKMAIKDLENWMNQFMKANTELTALGTKFDAIEYAEGNALTQIMLHNLRAVVILTKLIGFYINDPAFLKNFVGENVEEDDD